MGYPKKVDLGVRWVTHSFIVISRCPYPLLGHGLLTKVGAQIRFGPEGVQVLSKDSPIRVLTVAPEEEYKLYATSPLDTGKDPFLERLWDEIPGI